MIAAGFEVVATYRSPHVTITFYDDVDTGVARLLAVSHRVVTNPAEVSDVTARTTTAPLTTTGVWASSSSRGAPCSLDEPMPNVHVQRCRSVG